MTFYPMYIPVYYGGGGDPKGTALGLLIALGIGVVGVNYINRPKFQMKICKKSHYLETLHVNIRYKGAYPRVSSLKHYNTDSLRKKGYNIREEEQRYSEAYLSNIFWNSFAAIDNPKEDFVDTCKELNVYTELIYSYDNFFGKEVQDKKKLYWHKNYVEELK